MRFTEAQTGNNLIIQIVFEEQNIDLPSKIIDIRGDNLIVNVIYLDEKMLNLSGDNVRINIMLIRENKVPIIWKNVTCKIIHENDKPFYQITSYSEGYENNRREAFRLFLGNGGVAQLGIHKKAIEVVVKDVSENGFSFLTSTDIKMAVGKPVRLVFADLDITFSLMGIVVRKLKIHEKEILYGCKLSVKNNKLLQYIRSKQRQTISANKNYTKVEAPQRAVVPQNTVTSKNAAVFQNAAVKVKKKDIPNVKRYETTAEMKNLFATAYNQGNSQNIKTIDENKEREKHISSLNREQRRAAYKNSHVGKKV